MTTAPENPRRNLSGFVLLDKPVGLTSTQAMAKTRRLFGGKKIGHGGTLDPFATGLLLIGLGEATKALPYILANSKEYEFVLRFGAATDSQDITGNVVATSDIIPSPAAIENILPSFLGKGSQIPPLFSAIKVQGVRSYEVARKWAKDSANNAATGLATPPPPSLASRPIDIYNLSLVEQSNATDFVLRVRGAAGLYVRTLGHDIAKKLGSHGHLAALKRLSVGNFSLNDAFSLAKLEKIDYSHRVESALIDFYNKKFFSDNPVDKNLATLMGLETISLNEADSIALRLGKKIIVHYSKDRTKNKAENEKNNLNILLALDNNKQPIGFVSYEAKNEIENQCQPCINTSSLESLLIPKRIFVL